MTARTWIGGGANNASNPKDWSPSGLPAQNQTLQIVGAPVTTIQNPTLTAFTMNVSGNDLKGDSLSIDRANVTLNKANGAVVNAQVKLADVTFNLSGGSTLNMNVSTIMPLYSTHNAINVSGSDTLHLYNLNNADSVHIAKNSTLSGSFTASYGANVAIGGAAGSGYLNNSASAVSRASANISVPVNGTGSFTLSAEYARMEFASSVGVNQSVVVAGSKSVLQIDQPGEFQGSVTLANDIGAQREIDLMGLATADSYTYQNDILSIYSGNAVIETLRLNSTTRTALPW